MATGAKIVAKICNLLIGIILIITVTLTGMLLLPRAIGYQVYGVLSGSMEPTFHVGSVVYVKPTAPENIAVNDPITFRLPNNTLVATHRAIAIDPEAQTFTTKGDANDAIDMEPIPFSALIGKAVFTIPYLGYLSLFLQSKQGILVGVGILLLVIFLSLLSSLCTPEEENSKKKKRKKGGSQTTDPEPPSPDQPQ